MTGAAPRDRTKPRRNPVGCPSWADLYVAGCSAAEAAAARGVELTSAYGWVYAWRTAGVPISWSAPVFGRRRPCRPVRSGLADWQSLFDAGLTAPQAARRLGRRSQAARQWAEGHGLRWPAATEKVETAASRAWRAQHAAGKTQSEAARALGRTVKAAREWSRRAGVEWSRAGGPGSAGAQASAERRAEELGLSAAEFADFRLFCRKGLTKDEALDVIARSRRKAA
jgi:transposase